MRPGRICSRVSDLGNPRRDLWLGQMNLDNTVQRNITRAIAALALVMLIAVVLGVLFESYIAAASERLLDDVGVPLLGLAVAFNDFVISPIPPDFLLLILSKSGATQAMFAVVTFFGLCSALGGTAAWFIARRYGHPEWFGERFGTAVEEHHALIRRYGAWAVGVAALTPIPFSLVCWAAGFVRLDFARFAPMALLRIPRFLIYFAALVFSDTISQMIG